MQFHFDTKQLTVISFKIRYLRLKKYDCVPFKQSTKYKDFRTGVDK
jgi:hypothetical protein